MKKMSSMIPGNDDKNLHHLVNSEGHERSGVLMRKTCLLLLLFYCISHPTMTLLCQEIDRQASLRERKNIKGIVNQRVSKLCVAHPYTQRDHSSDEFDEVRAFLMAKLVSK